MKIQLPNGERLTLSNDLSIEEKMHLVEEMIARWDESIQKNWNSESIIYFLDGLANYIVWHKEDEQKNKQDKIVLSVKRVSQMKGKRKSMSLPFSSLPILERELLGLEVQKGEQ